MSELPGLVFKLESCPEQRTNGDERDGEETTDEALRSFICIVSVPSSRRCHRTGAETQSSSLHLLLYPAPLYGGHAHRTPKSKVRTGIVEFSAVCNAPILGLDCWKHDDL